MPNNRVLKGKQWLDKTYFQWQQHINCHTLDLRSPIQGICGQLWGYYGRGPDGTVMGDRKLEKLGFVPTEDDDWDHTMELLQQLWLDQLK